MLFGMLVCMFLLYTAGTVDIASVSDVTGSILLFDTLSLVILNDLNISSSVSIVSRLCYAVLSVYSVYHNCSFLPDGFVSFSSLTTMHSSFAR